MTDLFIDDKAIRFMKKVLAKENTCDVRIFTGGGGCCKRFEITPVRKPLPGDVTYQRGGITIHVERALVDNTEAIDIRFEEPKGLIINFR